MEWQSSLLVGSAVVLLLGLVYYVRGGRGETSAAPAGENRRKYPRVSPPAKKPVRVQIMGADFLDRFCVNDISIGGLSVTVPHLFDGCRIDETVDLIVSLPGKRAFQARGEIRHLRQAEGGALFGVMFTEIDEQHRNRIGLFVDRHSDRIV